MTFGAIPIGNDVNYLPFLPPLPLPSRSVVDVLSSLKNVRLVILLQSQINEFIFLFLFLCFFESWSQISPFQPYRRPGNGDIFRIAIAGATVNDPSINFSISLLLFNYFEISENKIGIALGFCITTNCSGSLAAFSATWNPCAGCKFQSAHLHN